MIRLQSLLACRCIVQLTVLGYILVPIFTYQLWYLVIGYSLLMLLVGSWEASSRPPHTYKVMLHSASCAHLNVMLPFSLESLTASFAGNVPAHHVLHWRVRFPLHLLHPAAGCKDASLVASTVLHPNFGDAVGQCHLWRICGPLHYGG